jgi:uncharacterized protein YkwD
VCCPTAHQCENLCCEDGYVCLTGTCCLAERACDSQCCLEGTRCIDKTCCPPERECGKTCCLDAICIDNDCCPTGRACGNTCCPPGQRCIGEQCWADSEETSVVALINAFRASNHVTSALVMQARLGFAAELHSQDQATHNVSGHVGSNGSTPDQRIAANGYAAQTWGETVASHGSDGSAQMAFSLWQNNPQDRDVMLNATFLEIGVGRAQSASGVWYWTADFAKPSLK